MVTIHIFCGFLFVLCWLDISETDFAATGTMGKEGSTHESFEQGHLTA